jgi:glycosyltransferase involved in cell wall biosynthesis
MCVCADLTIAIPVYNEEKNLAGCLQAIGNNFAKHIVIIDSDSTDLTKQIASSFEVDIIDFEWDGKFPKKRNWFLRNHTPQTKWVLFLDADEYLTNDFKEELCKALNNTDNVGYWLNYKIYFLGKALRGGYPLRKLALFKVGAGEYENIEEQQWSSLDMEIHEHPVLKGKTGIIKSKIDHRDFGGIAQYITKHNEYSSWEAKRFLKLVSQEKDNYTWTWKQKLKYRLIRSPFLGIGYFFGSYIFMGGFLDGSRGLTFAILKMSYFLQVCSKIRERK